MALLGFVVSVLVAVVLGGVAVALGPRLGFVDLPDNDLKPHQGSPVPLGGAGVLAGLHIGLAVTGLFNLGLLLATLLVWLVGLYDDRRTLNPWLRLAAAAVAGVIVVILAEQVVWPLLWVAVAMLAVNAVNLLDGLDALAGSVTAVAAFGLGLFAVAQGVADPWAVIALAGALVGFLYWNIPAARLFLGDNGAYVVGIALVWAGMRASPGRSASLVAVALIGVPLLDLAVTVVRRGISRTRLFAGDRDHTYDRLHQAGVTAGVIALLFAAFQALWSIGLVTVSVRMGDRAAVVTAAIAGVVIVGLLSIIMARSRPSD